MALGITVERSTVVGNIRYVAGTFDFDSSYPTGGEAVDLGTLGLEKVEAMVVTGKSGVIFEYNYTDNKVVAVFPTGGAGTPGSALATPDGVAASGSSSATAVDATTPTVVLNPGVGKEVANTQNLSTLTGVKFVAFGY